MSTTTHEYGTLREKIAAEKAARAERHNLFQALHQNAHAAADAAARGTTPAAIVVGHPSTPLGNDIDPTKQTWFEPEGMCGFAWVTVQPGNHPFANWLKKEGIGQPKGFGGGGVWMWVGDYGQSYDRKTTYARTYAGVVREGLAAIDGLKPARVSPGGRLD